MKYSFAMAAVLAAVLVLFSASCSSDSDDTPLIPTGAPERDGSMRLIHAAGVTFSMGSTSGYTDESPVHSVSFTRDFYMDSTEVTQSAFDAVMSAVYPGYRTPGWAAPYGVGADYPTYLTEWGDAALYCNARSTQAGLDTVYSYTSIVGTPGNGCRLEGMSMHPERNGYRLPTEAEWEFACGAGSTGDYFWGKNSSPYPANSVDSLEMSGYAVWAANSWYLSSDNTGFGTHRVATGAPNAFGLYDMVGNVTEWCHDWYGEAYYAQSASVDPTGPETGDWHALRGGHWGSDAAELRSANRTFIVPDYLFYFIGFRTVRPVE